jgi:heme/copper-type cytochrome/quinol oxidase subunit 1
MNMIFLPMFLQGMAGMHRRWYDGGQGWTVSAEHDLGTDRFSVEHSDLMGGLDHGSAQIPFIINFFLEHQARRKGERQSVGSNDAGMDCAFAAAARKFRYDTASLIAALTSTACPDAIAITQCKTNRWSRASACGARPAEPVLV